MVCLILLHMYMYFLLLEVSAVCVCVQHGRYNALCVVHSSVWCWSYTNALRTTINREIFVLG